MAYRETAAWLTLAAMAIGYGPFFLLVGQGGPPDVLRFVFLFALASLVRLAIEGGGRLILAVRHGRQPADERDRAIASRSVGFAYMVLLVGMILVGGIMPFTDQGVTIAYAGLFFIVLAETIRCLAVALSYRLGWQ